MSKHKGAKTADNYFAVKQFATHDFGSRAERRQ